MDREIFEPLSDGIDEAHLIYYAPLLLEHSIELAMYVSEIMLGPEMFAALKKAQATLAALKRRSYYPPPWHWDNTPEGEHFLLDASREITLGLSAQGKLAERELIAQAERLHRHLRTACQALHEVTILGGRENQRAALSLRLGTPQYWHSAAEFYRLYVNNFGPLPDRYRILQRGTIPTSFKK